MNNNRILKFRVWDKHDKIFISQGEGLNFINLAEYESENQHEYEEEGKSNNFYIFQQFTGLFDKNGKEIYEGDILQTIYSLSERINYICYFEDGSFKIKDKYGFVRYFYPDIFEIIGNIFENSKLIK